MNTYLVTIPIAGHLTFEVEAETPAQAITMSRDMDSDDGELQWDTLTRFHQGNVCYCPSPWELTVELLDL